MISRARRRALDLRRKLELSGRVDVVRVASMLELDVQLWPLENMEELVVDRFICVARRLEPEWRRWVVAHAIGHRLLHPGNHIWIRLHTRLAFKFEREAEEFAGALLMDGSEAVDAGLTNSWEIAEYFGVPEKVVRLQPPLVAHHHSGKASGSSNTDTCDPR